MKKILLLSLLAAPLAMADISLGTTQQPQAGQTASVDATEYVSMAQEVIASLNELTATLMGVHDKASADAICDAMFHTFRDVEYDVLKFIDARKALLEALS